MVKRASPSARKRAQPKRRDRDEVEFALCTPSGACAKTRIIGGKRGRNAALVIGGVAVGVGLAYVITRR